MQAGILKSNYSDNSINKDNNEQVIVDNKWKKCVALQTTMTDITTTQEYKKFDFQPAWLRNKEFWGDSFETRYEQIKQNKTKPNLRVFHLIYPNHRFEFQILSNLLISGDYCSIFA